MAKGWTWLLNTKKDHYFYNSSISLCGKWMIFSDTDLEDVGDDHPDNCKMCLKKLQRIRKREKEAKDGIQKNES